MKKEEPQNKPETSKALATLQRYDLAQPQQVADMANVMKAHIVKQNLYTNIQGKNYAHVDGWQFGGSLIGTYPRVAKVENMSTDKETRWFAEVEVIQTDTDKVLSRGFAICSSAESKKRGNDEYAILSMAQTRAIGKAYRNVIGWVMKLAGYESTPKEEMSAAAESAERTAKANSEVKKETVVEAAQFCGECAKEGLEEQLAQQVADYSIRVFGKPLCRTHQPKPKAPKHG